ncbi:hypothetical protein HGA13_06075 [Nocardia speluncae]|uniref:Uncharacterized protein n=1 Tax=Nocardia speluncae TaxID=419477 RepID=A0A846XD88_9NOCA|nr:hypothetical protein [Nocardia speluncae]NKY32646.1 hypothetical protein [Nocardia speluncae]
MRYIVETVGAFAVGAAITVTVPFPAHATPGEFSYRSQIGGPAVLDDLDPDRCYNTPGAAGVLANDTGMHVAAFPGPNCEGVPMDAETRAFESVVFSS